MIRRLDAAPLLDSFFVAAVATLLAIRWYLDLAGWPQIGGGGLHIAHMLWGGLGMLIALVTALAFSGRRALWVVALAGGAGFGAFVDELGKFITSDNNYFFQPTVAILYVIFIALFLAIQAIGRRRPGQPERLSAALEIAQRAVAGPIDVATRGRALAWLDAGDSTNPLTLAIRRVVEAAPTVADRAPSWLQRLGATSAAWRDRLAASRWTTPLLVALFATQVLGSVGSLLVATAGPAASASPSLATWIQGAAVTIAALLTVAGLLLLARDRRRACEVLRAGLLVSILVTQVFDFADYEFAALVGLAWSILLLLLVSSLAGAEAAAPARRNDSATLDGTPAVG